MQKGMDNIREGDCASNAGLRDAAGPLSVGKAARAAVLARGDDDPANALLIASGLCKPYNFRPVLRGVSLTLPPGTLTVVYGPNGAGKSTLLRILAGLAQPDAGLIHRAAPPEAMGFMNHESCAYGGLTALENLTFWSKLHDLALPRAALEDLLREAGLGEVLHEPAMSFSQGMLQRLNVVRCFAPRPSLVLLDEPGTGLDRAGLALLKGRLDEVRGAGGAAVVVSHQIRDFLPEADFVLALSALAPEGAEAENMSSVSYGGPAAAFKLPGATPEAAQPLEAGHV